MTRKALGEFIAHARESMDMTQVELAKKVEVTAGQVSKWERGLSIPSARKLAKLADAIQIDKAELYERFDAAHQEELTVARRELADVRRDLEYALNEVKRFVDTYAEFHAEYQRIGTQVNQLTEFIGQAKQDIAEIKRAVVSDPRRARP